jgi:DNA polymerase III epsilon subunit-like protein
MYIVFDTETTGLPRNYSAPAEDVDNWPRIIQISWALFDESGNQVKRICKLIKPEGWEIPKEEFWIKNGYSTEKSLAEGVPLKEVLEEFVQDRLASHYAIAHNLSFDAKIIRAEMIRAGLNIEFTAKKVCTMQKSTSYCQIPKASGRGAKWPTLTELHNKLFQTDFEGAHDAGADVDACAKCFFELIRLNVITLD